jgi:predicted O-methyltransferase YrrM
LKSQHWFRARAFLKYWLDAVDAHSLHSPFLYDLYTRVIRSHGGIRAEVEQLRQELLNDNRILSYADPGSGTDSGQRDRTVAHIVKTSCTPVKYASLYARLCAWLRPCIVVELGTCLGLTTLYLSADKERSVFTFEGVPELAAMSRNHFYRLGVTHITLVEGNISHTLRPSLDLLPRIDLALVDANHRYEPTLRYIHLLIQKTHPGSLIIVDDIHHNEEMDRAWNEIRRHPLVYVSVDLFRCGLLFFDPSTSKQHAVLQF